MSLNNNLLREYIINNFLKEQISIEKNKSLNESELDNFIEMTTINNSTIQDIEPEKEKSYNYLDGDILSKEFSLYREQEILELKKYTISLCFFNINENMNIPFLEFLFDNQSGEFDFPNKELDINIIANIYKKENIKKINIENTSPFQDFNSVDKIDDTDDTDDNGGFDEVEIEFFNQCCKFAQEITFLSDDVLEQRYLGFIEKDNILYIVFDTTNLDILYNINDNKKNGYFIGIIDEIVNRKKIFETPINEKIIELFQSSLMKNIYDNNNRELNIPKLVYLCTDEDTESDINNKIVPVPVVIKTEPKSLREQSSLVSQEQPSIVSQEQPSLVSQEQPSLVSQEQPSLVSQEQPSIISQEQPSIISQEQPSLVSQEQPSLVSQEQPSLVSQEQPSIISQEQPSLVSQEQPSLVSQEQPSLVSQEQPSLVSQEQPSLVSQEQPSLVSQEQPSLVISNTIEQNKANEYKGGNNENQYKNVYYNNELTNSNSQTISLINPKIYHQLFDNIYLFTSEPIIEDYQKGIVQEFISSVVNDRTNEIYKLKRYALQLDSVKYYKDVDVKTLIEQNEVINPNYDVYCFYQDNREYWAVKSINSFTEI
jgi:hypothetical protein